MSSLLESGAFSEQLASLTGMYGDFFKKIEEIDDLLDSQSDQASAGKRALRNRIVEKFEEQNTPQVERVVSQIAALENLEEKVAIFSALVKGLNTAFEKEVDEYLQKTVDENKKTQPTETLSDDQIKALGEQRSLLYKNMKGVRELAFLYGGKEDAFPVPPKRVGTVGKRGKRAISLYDWTINGEAVGENDNNLLAISKKYNYDSAADLRKAIMEALSLKDLKNPPSPLVFTLPGGDVLSGTRDMTEEVSEEDENEDDENENGEDDDETTEETA